MWEVINQNPGTTLLIVFIAGVTIVNIFKYIAIIIRGQRPPKQVYHYHNVDESEEDGS